MITKTVSAIGVNSVVTLYEQTVKGVVRILKRRHKMTASEADEAVRASPLRTIFQNDPEMAAHTSNETWAREVYNFWDRRNTDKS